MSVETTAAWRPEDDVAEVLISEEALKARIAELGREITADYEGRPLLMLGVLKGAVLFLVDLAREVKLPLEIDFMAVSSYGASTRSSGVVRILKDLNNEIEGRDVLVVEDIVDSGLTLQYLLDVLQVRNPASIEVVALLRKDKPDAAPVQVDLVGFAIPDEFVVGYGLDYAERYRNLPYVAILDPSTIQSEGGVEV
jgi:hypoxanthine phosphoribosyltransferase